MRFDHLSEIEKEKTQQLEELIKNEIAAFQTISFARYMELALYAPGLGYYMSDSPIFGKEGDFTTAPEISPLFSYCLARQIASLLEFLQQKIIIECGGGRGQMALDILSYLKKEKKLPEKYCILETSPTLIQAQQEKLKSCLPDYFPNIEWIHQIEFENQEAVVIGNEFLDALPVHQFYYDGEFKEIRVHFEGETLKPIVAPIQSKGLENALKKLKLKLTLPYKSEINLNYMPLLTRLSRALKKGFVLWLDYGYSRKEYYSPDRNAGTLQCFYHHKRHDNPFLLMGLQDITAHVDFTSLYRDARENGFKLAGYTTQAHFLINCGIDQFLIELPEKERFLQAQKLKILLMPQEMGETIKVMGLQKNMRSNFLGFSNFDQRKRLMA